MRFLTILRTNGLGTQKRGWRSQRCAFDQVQAQAVKMSAVSPDTKLTLCFQQTELTLPLSVDPRWLAGLIKTLAA